jgi:hypothetical protein
MCVCLEAENEKNMTFLLEWIPVWAIHGGQPNQKEIEAGWIDRKR